MNFWTSPVEFSPNSLPVVPAPNSTLTCQPKAGPNSWPQLRQYQFRWQSCGSMNFTEWFPIWICHWALRYTMRPFRAARAVASCFPSFTGFQYWIVRCSSNPQQRSMMWGPADPVGRKTHYWLQVTMPVPRKSGKMYLYQNIIDTCQTWVNYVHVYNGYHTNIYQLSWHAHSL